MESVGCDQEYRRRVGGVWPPMAERKSVSSTAMFIAPSPGGSSKIRRAVFTFEVEI